MGSFSSNRFTGHTFNKPSLFTPDVYLDAEDRGFRTTLLESPEAAKENVFSCPVPVRSGVCVAESWYWLVEFQNKVGETEWRNDEGDSFAGQKKGR